VLFYGTFQGLKVLTGLTNKIKTLQENTMSAWIYLGVAIIFEVIGTVLLKLSDGFEKIGFGMLAIACYSICFWFFAPALKIIPAGVAYAIWAGFGILSITLIGLAFFGQKLTLLNYGFVFLILIGAIGLNLTTEIHKA